jgi:6-pyruvoyltetrahydropterin/6-carboxytetrahydropterin synthase
MLQVTKIFRFEMAHAIVGYEGPCKNIHGHSYELHVTTTTSDKNDRYLPAPGFVIDFKDLKRIVQHTVIQKLDHKLVLSKDFLAKNPSVKDQDNLFLWDAEPSAENLLIFFHKNIQEHLPEGVRLKELKLYETNDSYAEWVNDK